MKMKTKCSFYLPVEFPLTASLTGGNWINSWLAAENSFWLFSSQCKRKAVISWSLSGNLHYTRPMIYVYAGQLGAHLILASICGLSTDCSQIICLPEWETFSVHFFLFLSLVTDCKQVLCNHSFLCSPVYESLQDKKKCIFARPQNALFVVIFTVVISL